MVSRNQIFSEFLGTAGLLLIVVGSGIMAERLAHGDLAIALLANSLATGAGLYALIECFAPISGAHFNPVVSLCQFRNRAISARKFAHYVLAQCAGAFVGVGAAHLLFDLPLLQVSLHDRVGAHLLFSEFLATFGLVGAITLVGHHKPIKVPSVVALYIVSAYWFSSSTSFANPAVTLARSLTDTFAGIHWLGTPGFVLAQISGAMVAQTIAKFIIGGDSV